MNKKKAIGLFDRRPVSYPSTLYLFFANNSLKSVAARIPHMITTTAQRTVIGVRTLVSRRITTVNTIDQAAYVTFSAIDLDAPIEEIAL